MNAGGVITRIIRDEPDDRKYHREYPEDISLSEPEAIEYIEAEADNPTFDAQPDLFTFNFLGFTGKFVFDRDGRPVLMPFQNFLIERIFTPTAPGVGYFKITTPDGVIYTFGNNGATETSKTYNAGSGCGKDYSFFSETAWYLTSIEHPLGDVIHFEYTNDFYVYAAGVSQTIAKFSSEEGNCEGVTCPQSPPIKTCVNKINLGVSILSRIWSENFGEVNFLAAKDRLDVHDYKLNEIQVVQPDGESSKFSFSYVFSNSQNNFANTLTEEQWKHRMFLESIVKSDDAGILFGEKYQFTYEDINALPPRLSYARDHWGYFNGVENEYLVAGDEKITDVFGRRVFEGLTADREPHPQYADKGILKKIIYPTGGTSEFVYEPNTFWGNEEIYPTKSSAALTAQGQASWPFTGSDELEIYNVQNQEVKILLTASMEEGHMLDETHDKAVMVVTDLTTNSEVFRQALTPDGSQSYYLNLTADHLYKCALEVGRGGITGSASFDYYPEKIRKKPANVVTGGLRIAEARNVDPVTGKGQVKKYHYGRLSSLESSGEISGTPNYFKSETNKLICYDNSYNPPVPICNKYVSCTYLTLYSNSLVNLYPTSGNNIYYRHVVITQGESGFNGAEEHEFNIHFDTPGLIVWGEPIVGAPNTNFGWNNGLKKGVKTYKTDARGNSILVRDVQNEYTTDTRNEREVPALVVRKLYQPTCPPESIYLCGEADVNKVISYHDCTVSHEHKYSLSYLGWVCIAEGSNTELVATWSHPCNGMNPGDHVTIPSALDHLDVLEYKNIGYWHYLTSITQKVYDENGLNPVVTREEYTYDNETHGLLTSKRILDGAGQVIEEQRIRYPDDFNDIENFATLKAKHIVSSPVKVEKSLNGVQSSGNIITYNDLGQQMAIYRYENNTERPLPAHDPAQVDKISYALDTELFYYDTSNNPKEIVSADGVKRSFIWGYNDTKLVAFASGAGATNIYFNGFEEAGIEGNARTGDKYHDSGSFTIPVEDQPQGEQLKMSYWYWDTDHWVFSGELDYTPTIATSGTRIDEIRVYPEGAEMTTYSYDLGVGVSTITDSNNVTSYYDYDDLGRVLEIKDDQGNILKKYKYQYSQSN
ncbi:hypothetical protein C900_04069 [Fulvivirga imtechensis AK7]|uniref:YD repeat protein n=1 Tax=Fulvivirga imtechensis AK7 TaxID=1237149 RepID=L8JRS9_9BACT|nr:hypothetical protein C900_04069 [Fulvivirga imtechensis AK7]